MFRTSLFAFAALAFVTFTGAAAQANTIAGHKLRFCPDEWISDKMPTVGKSPKARSYFIVKGQRRELAEFDLKWVKKHCHLKPTIVQ